MLEARALTLTQPAPLQALQLACPPGALTVILGPNGAGKSTLLHALAGSIAAARPAVYLDDTPLSALGATRLAARRAVVEQHPARPAGMRVIDLLRIGSQRPHADAWQQALDATDCHDLLARDCATLSGGELARVHLARAVYQLLAGDAACRYLLLDEPTAALDIGAANLQLGSLRQLARRWQLGVVAVLHDVNLALRHADHVLLLQDGRSVASGPAASVLRRELLEQVYATRLVELNGRDGLRAFVAGDAEP